MPHDDLVLGFDIGGTTTRALLCDLAGGTAGYGEAGGGNPNSHPVADAVREVSNAARQALSGTDPAAVRHGVLGMAGSSKDRKSTRLNSSHVKISYAVFCLKKKNQRAQDAAAR